MSVTKVNNIGKFIFRVFIVLIFGSANATVLTFEDLNPAPLSYDVMPTIYGGLSFSGWYFGPDVVYMPASGSIDLYTNYADPNDPGNYVITTNNSITSASGFYFDGAWFSGYSGVTFELSLNGAVVALSAALPDAPGFDPYGPTFLASGYGGLVDTVKVSGVQGYYAMDDFTYRSAGVVPEPASWALLLAGLGIAGTARRRSGRH